MKIIKKINIALALMSLLIILSYLWIMISKAEYPTALFCIILIVGVLGIYYVDLKTRFKIPEESKLIYLSFLFFASIMGSLVNLYSYFEYYDIIMHFISGVIATYIGYVIYKHFNKDNAHNFLFMILFIISFNLAIATSWELFEYILDLVFGYDTQKVKLYGIHDTMQDTFAALGGGLLFIIIYYKKLKK